MATTSERMAGAVIAIAAAIFAVAGLAIGQRGVPIAGAIAAVGIMIGTGLARGKFSSLSSKRRN